MEQVQPNDELNHDGDAGLSDRGPVDTGAALPLFLGPLAVTFARPSLPKNSRNKPTMCTMPYPNAEGARGRFGTPGYAR